MHFKIYFEVIEVFSMYGKNSCTSSIDLISISRESMDQALTNVQQMGQPYQITLQSLAEDDVKEIHEAQAAAATPSPVTQSAECEICVDAGPSDHIEVDDDVKENKATARITPSMSTS